MDLIRTVLRYAHIILGFAGLVVFWIPVFAPKGKRVHVFAGRIFAVCGYAVAGSAVINAVLLLATWLAAGRGPSVDPANFGFLIFLLYLGIAVFAGVHHGVRVMRVKRETDRLDTPFHHALVYAQVAGSGLVIAYALIWWTDLSIVLLALSPIGVIGGLEMRQYITRAPTMRMHWWYEHMGAMLGTGIAFYTAFAVFGSRQFIDFNLTGAWVLVPWILPAAIGVPATQIWTRYYQRKFGDRPSRPADAAVEVGTAQP